MKKSITSIYFAGLALMLPAVFFGYLYHNSNDISNPVTNQVTMHSIENDETVYKPGLLFVIKGM